MSAAISLVISATALTADGTARVEGRPTVFVHIQNHAAVWPEVIAGARDQLAHVYEAAGVHVESSVDPDHGRCANQLTVHVALLAGAMANSFIKTERVKRTVLAQANSEARRVYVFWKRLGPSIDRYAVAHGDALGIVIAH